MPLSLVLSIVIYTTPHTPKQITKTLSFSVLCSPSLFRSQPIILSLFAAKRSNHLFLSLPLITLLGFSFFSNTSAMEQNFFEPQGHFESDGDISVKKWKSMSTPTTVSDNDSGCFECNICLDSAHEPVVTLCGHLYCWPCIYKWLQVPSASDEPNQLQQTCPVCKANITPSSVVPLYGRGTGSKGKKPNLGLVVPRRPPPRLDTSFTSTSPTSPLRQQLHSNYYYTQTHPQSVYDQYSPSYGGYATNSESAYLGSTMLTHLSNPTIGMVGEFVFARMFGSSDTNLFAHPYLNTYPPSSPRMRRQEVQLDKSLNRVTIFLFCCFMLCLLLF